MIKHTMFLYMLPAKCNLLTKVVLGIMIVASFIFSSGPVFFHSVGFYSADYSEVFNFSHCGGEANEARSFRPILVVV